MFHVFASCYYFAIDIHYILLEGKIIMNIIR